MRFVTVSLLVTLLSLFEPLALAASPTDVTVSLHVGDTVESALVALNATGLRIVYSSALVVPTMTLRSVPKSSNVETLLQEILSPWQLHAVHTKNDEWLVVSNEPNPKTSTDSAPAVEVKQSIDNIVVTGSRFGLATDGTSSSFLNRKSVENMPHLADDAIRILKVLPGVSGGDFSAMFNTRGGRRDETMLLIDGAEIHNAVHFRDVGGTFSVMDTHLIQSINFITGGMTVDYNDYMSGVVDMRTHRPNPDDEYRNAAGVSFIGAFGRTGGTFDQDKGSWVLSVRRGFLDILAAMAEGNDAQLVPRYTDVFASMNFDFSDRTSVATHLLFSNDDLKFITKNNNNDVDSAGRGQSLHAWVTVDNAWSDTLHTQTILAAATLNITRNSQGADDQRSGEVLSDNDVQFLDFRQDWSWEVNENNFPRWGFNINRQQADYDYALRSQIFDPFLTPVPIDTAYGTQLKVSGSKYGAYGSWRARLTDSFTAEAGARWDSYSYPQHTGADVQPLNFDTISPRINLVYSFGGGNVIRAAWGITRQPQGIGELQVEDNVTKFFGPERSDQVTIGYSGDFDHGFSFRFDAYVKHYSHLRPIFENALDPTQLIPEGSIDRIGIDAPKALAQGIEITLRREASRGFSGWMSLALAEAEEDEKGEWRPRAWEQQQTFSFGSSWTGVKWNISLAGTIHSGTPITYIGSQSVANSSGGVTQELVVGPRNGERLGVYSRIDFRASRTVQMRSARFSYYLEVTNLLNHENECCISDFGLERDGSGNSYFFKKVSYGFPILPSLGFQFEF